MFLNKDYYLSAEIADVLDKHIATFSSWYNEHPDLVDSNLIIKYGQNVFLHKNLPLFSDRIRSKLREHKFTDFSKLLPLSYILNEFKGNRLFIEKRGVGDIVTLKFKTDKEKTYSRDFIKFRDEIYNKLKGKTLYFANDETMKEDLQSDPDITFVQIAKNSYIGAY